MSPTIPDSPRSPGFLADLRYYTGIFHRFVGNRMYVVFGLMLFSALLEGFGIVLLLPLLQSMGQGAFGADGLSQTLTAALATVGATTPVQILLVIMALYLIKGVVAYYATALSGRLRIHLQRDLQTRLYDAYGQMDYRYYTQRDTGHFVNVMNQVYPFINVFYGFTQFLIGLLRTLTYIGMAFAVAWVFGLMAAVVGGLMLLFFRRFNRLARDLSTKAAHELGFFSRAFIESMQSFKYLSATGQAKPLRKAAIGSMNKMATLMERQNLATAFTAAVREPLAVSAIVAIVIFQIAVLEQPLAPIVVSILLFYRGVNAILGLQGSWQNTLSQIGAVELVTKEFDQLQHHQQRAQGRPAPQLDHGIELKDIEFRYRDEGEATIKGLNITIPARQTVALVGASGAGKSTIIDLITLLLTPQSGQILIDGVPASEIDPSSWREQIGYVLQDTVIFDASIADNISLWQGNMRSDPELADRIEKAAKAAHLDEFVRSLPDGYETTVGDRGIRLSGGQRQRLFIARELFKQPRLLILDEATSSLDAEAEKAIQESIEDLKGTLTVVIIAHRLATVKQADRIYVLQQGVAREQGSFDELSQRTDSRFRAMVELQQL